MKKIAIFVEGPTELVFIEKFLLEIGNAKHLSIRKEVLTGGGKSPLVIRLIGNEIPETNDTKYHILLRCSCNDDKVLSDIKSNYNARGHKLRFSARQEAQFVTAPGIS